MNEEKLSHVDTPLESKVKYSFERFAPDNTPDSLKNSTHQKISSPDQHQKKSSGNSLSPFNVKISSLSIGPRRFTNTQQGTYDLTSRHLNAQTTKNHYQTSNSTLSLEKTAAKLTSMSANNKLNHRVLTRSFCEYSNKGAVDFNRYDDNGNNQGSKMRSTSMLTNDGKTFTQSYISGSKKSSSGNIEHHTKNSSLLRPPNDPDNTASYKKLSAEQKTLVNRALNGESFFFTGVAGTGKSYVLGEIIHQLRKYFTNPGDVQVTAPTGIASILIGGITIYSFAGIGIGEGTVESLCTKVHKNRTAKSRWLNVRTLIIDEISMLSVELFEKLEAIARNIRRSNLPFGGIQMILSGDFFQLPPVVPRSRLADDNVYCFQSKKWPIVVPKTFILSKVFRQKDDNALIRVLNEVRQGKLSAQSSELLSKCIGRVWDDGLEPIRLYPLKKQVASYNAKRLEELRGLEYTYAAKDTGPENYLRQLLDSCAASTQLVLKKGAQVVLLKNIDIENELANGTRGIVVDFYEDPKETTTFPVVVFENREERVIQYENWDLLVDDKVVASRAQVPLDLAWALSIHKSQGMSLSRVEVSLKSVFEAGQAYVALSRVKSLVGLRISDSVDEKYFRAHPRVVEFYKTIVDCSVVSNDVANKQEEKSN